MRELELLDFLGLEIDYEEYDNTLEEIYRLESKLQITIKYKSMTFFYD